MAGASWLVFVSSVVLVAGAGCQACPAEARFLCDRPDFRAPEAAGRSFWAAVACDDATAAYRCLGEGLKAEHGATFDGFLLFWRELRDRHGAAFRHAWRLRTVGDEEVREDGVLLWWGLGAEPRVGLLMTEQPYVELEPASGTAVEAYLDRPPRDLVEPTSGGLTLRLPGAVLRDLPDPLRLRRLELGSEWKIRDVLAPPSSGFDPRDSRSPDPWP